MPTLAEQLASVQAAITRIEEGAQSLTKDGRVTVRPELRTLYAREKDLLLRIDKGDRGRVTVAET